MRRAALCGSVFTAIFVSPFAPGRVMAHTGVTMRAAVPATAPALGRVRGVVFDSLTMDRVAGALVWLPGSARSVVADKDGRFEVDSVPAGKQVIAFSTPTLDSLGLGTLGAAVEVRADGVSQVTLATPSFRTVWRALCKPSAMVGTDSGIVWGTVRDAANDVRQAGAATRFNWADLRVGPDRKVVNEEITRDVRSDSTGSYYACGLPVETDISTEAEGSRSASGVVEFEIGAHRLLRVDLLVSTDMVAQPSTKERTPAEQAAILKARGTSTLHGAVHDDKGNPRRAADVRVVSVDSSVRTNEEGQFTLTDLPAGTQVVEVREVGFALRKAVVDFRPGLSTELDVILTPTNELATVNVKAVVPEGHFREDFEVRKKSGFGTTLEEKDFAGKYDMTGVLRALPSVFISQRRGLTQVTMTKMSLGGVGQCVPLVWIDGVRSVVEELSAIDPGALRAVESFPRASEAPSQYVGLQACGVILVWTKRARW